MPDTDVKQSVITGTVDYLKGQPFNNVLLTALLAVVCLGLGYGLPWAVREAKSGARELISDCKEERTARDKAFTDALPSAAAADAALRCRRTRPAATRRSRWRVRAPPRMYS